MDEATKRTPNPLSFYTRRISEYQKAKDSMQESIDLMFLRAKEDGITEKDINTSIAEKDPTRD